MDQVLLKEKLQKIKLNDFNIGPHETYTEWLEIMQNHIGDIDLTLRDELIYEIFYHWIWEKKSISDSELIKLLVNLIDKDHLFYKIGSRDDDAVFTRSFSVLAISLILCRHTDAPFLDENLFETVKEALINYYLSERDFRGYLEGKGWAHSAAHGADALDELVQCSMCTAGDHLRVLDAIEKVIFNGTDAFNCKEDDRMSNIVFMIDEMKLLTRTQLIQWMKALSEKCDFSKGHGLYISSVNFRNFNRSLYFKFKHYEGDENLLKTMLEIEKKLNANLY